MSRWWATLLWLDCTFLHPLHYVNPTLCQWLTHYVCYPIAEHSPMERVPPEPEVR